MRAGGGSQRFPHQPLSQSSQRARGPAVPASPAVTKPSEIPKSIASHDLGGPNLLQPILSLDTATAISDMPKVAGKKRTRDDKEALEGSSESPRTTKSLKRPSQEGQVSRKKICLPKDRPNEDRGEIQYLGTNQALTLSPPIPPPSLVRSSSGISPAPHSTVYASSPETCPPSSHQSFGPTPASSSESSPSTGQAVTTRGSSKQSPMRCPSPSLQYIWDAIENPVIPVLPPNWDVKAFEEAMERPVKAEDISLERVFYPFYAAKYDPEGLAKGTFGRRSQAELEHWFSRIRRWESENPEVVKAETRAQNEELRRLFGS
ncbi:hypothetical protein FS837_012760 [Tulasnella sp. UAMH 9824]|nr:hypothetical protein FS837_012760 [Tulasnella sp. UAMH 9824]